MSRVRAWWAGRSLRTRITLVVGVVALVAMAALSRLGGQLLVVTVGNAVDSELSAKADFVRSSLAAGADPATTRVAGIRIIDNAGNPVDRLGPVPLTDAQVRTLESGQPITDGDRTQLRRWMAVTVVVADGRTRYVLATTDLIGPATLLTNAAGWFVVGALIAAGVVALAAWAATRAALQPVDRMRAAAAGLPPGERLPLPAAHDELRTLAQEINLLLARRDEAAARMERFTGDAAHELRSPVAAIRTQAEVAVLHPDPALADETLRAIADEATRLSTMLAALLALARADSGQRMPAQAVDLVAAARAAVGRAGAIDDGPAYALVAPYPAAVGATPSEVGLVLDNLLSNAGRHAGTVVRVGVLPAGRWVRLVVEDDGPGIPADDRRRIFDRFVRLSPEAGPGAGAGLGLALVAALVRGRGGSVSASETNSGGARLEVRWPAP